VTVKAKVARKDVDGKTIREKVNGKSVRVFDEIEKTIKKDNPSRLNARRKMLSVFYGVTEIPKENKGKKRNTKAVDMPKKMFEEIAPRYTNRNGGYTRIIKIGTRKGDGAMEVLLELI
ncbi:MAG: L17 family ribosomal protein, partial [Parasporobacterium sp.]|nr:L17 family ribosomal protein [Parasporobacterium sp.]